MKLTQGLAVIIPLTLIFLISGCGNDNVTDGTTNHTDTAPTNQQTTSEQPNNTPPIEAMESTIVRVRYEFTGKQVDGSYFESGASGSGVIYSKENSRLSIFTNRHVVDCSFTDAKCFQRLNEKITVRTQDGQIHQVSRVSFAPHKLDMAMLEVDTSNANAYQLVGERDDIKVGEKVIAIGYPTYGIEGVYEFSRAKGTILELKDLIMDDGFAFKSIESDAYTNFGSSGGGLFDEYGNLIGINTWKDTNRGSAIKLHSLTTITFNYCETGYMDGDYCVEYCKRDEVLGQDRRCYKPCKELYCNSKEFNVNDPRCKNGLIAENDDYCHQPCESPSTYCQGSAYCYRNRCVTCPQANTVLYEDGTCRSYE